MELDPHAAHWATIVKAGERISRSELCGPEQADDFCKSIDLLSGALLEEIKIPWQPMRTAPKDGRAVLVLVEGSDIPRGVRWLRGPDDPYATEQTTRPGWHLTWDGTPIEPHDGPRYWMHCPADPDAN